jgi:adenylate cyclase
LAKVFLSYSRDDVAAAKRLAAFIDGAGHQVWWDHQIEGGSRFTAEIDRELKGADAVVVMWTKSSVESPWVQDEAAEGRDSGRLVPILLGTDKPPLGFRQFQSIDFGNWDGEADPPALDALIRAIAQKGGGAEASTATAKQAGKSRDHRASVCVLPFANMSGEPEQEYFSDGISEDIITDLSKVSALSVIARNTAFTFKGQAVDVKDVAKTLGVDHVLEGSVRKAGNRVRITAQLIDGKAGDHLWADRYDRDLTDIFEIQDEISKAIVDALKVTLLPAEKKAIENRGTSNVDAYNLYLMARQQWVTGTFGDPRREEAIVRLCKQATLLDPDYAEAWALMSLAQAELRFWHARGEEDPLPAAERALEINSDMAEAHCIKARYLEEAGRAEEAEQQMRKALQLGPESWEANREAARMLYRHGRTREAIPYFEKASSLMDADYNNPGMLMSCYQAIGDENGKRRAAKLCLERTERAIAKEPANGPALAMGANALALCGNKERAQEWMRRALLLDPDNLSMRYNVACSLALDLNDPDGALDALQPYFERVQSRTHIRHAEADPDFNGIRCDPRFKEMLIAAKQRLGMAATDADA